jgi:Outer membrane protein beta-barrel family/Carboxypeptidase regulatory-like domain
MKGIVADTLAKKTVGAATITLMQQADSSLVSFTMTDNKGNFSLQNISAGKYRLLITHVNYHAFSRLVIIDEANKNIDLGNLPLSDKTITLGEVVVVSEAPPVTMKDDTLEYNAGSFKTKPNAVVEDLLRRMPGIKVEKDGSIKAQGQTVRKVLVDGKEFFGNDPKIATRNLTADAVDKVQVYDRASDMSQLTGFDDGNSEKTLNLKLKKDKKKGAFGKVMAGAGTNDRWEGRFNVNSFKGARQLSAIGMGNNTNAEGFSFMDMLNFSGELNRMNRGGGGGNLSVNVSGDDPNSALFGLGGNRTGINSTQAGGLNYNNIIGTKTDFTSNYFYSRNNPTIENNTQRLYFLPDSSYFYNQDGLSDNTTNSHRFNFSADYRIDSFHSLRIAPSFGYQQGDNLSSGRYNTLQGSGLLTNEGYRNNIATNRGFNLRNDLLFRKKFRRKGRTFSFSLQNTINQSEGAGELESVNRFYNTVGALIRTDSLNQRYSSDGSLNGYTARAAYTDRIFRRSLIELSVSRGDTRNNSDKITNDFDKLTGFYNKFNNLLSNSFENTFAYSAAGIRLRTARKKYNYTIGLNWREADLTGKIFFGNKDSLIRKSFANLLPSARFEYKFNRFRGVSFNYQASTNQPSIAQLQPIPDNSNPLSIREGNPDLKQEYVHTIGLNYNSVDPFRNKNLFAFINVTQTRNKIINADFVDAFGVKRSRPVNVRGATNVMADFNLGLPFRPLKGSFSTGANIMYSYGKQLTNNAANNIRTINIRPDVRLDMNPGKNINVSVTAALNYYQTAYSLAAAPSAQYFTQDYGTEFNWQLPKHVFFSTEFTYTINSQRAAGFNTSVPIWNASISKQFLKFNRGELQIRVMDLLNRNIGISRSSNQNYIEDTRVNNLRRFFMLSFTYNLSKMGAADNSGGNIRVISR